MKRGSGTDNTSIHRIDIANGCITSPNAASNAETSCGMTTNAVTGGGSSTVSRAAAIGESSPSRCSTTTSIFPCEPLNPISPTGGEPPLYLPCLSQGGHAVARLGVSLGAVWLTPHGHLTIGRCLTGESLV